MTIDRATPILPTSSSRFTQTVGISVLVAWLILGARLTTSLATGGRGTLAVLDPALILVGVGIWCVTPTGKGKVIPARMYWRSAGPLFLLLLLLPVLGVAHGTHGVRSLYSIALVAIPWAIFMLGRVVRDPRRWRRGVAAAIWVQGAYGAAQLLNRLSFLPDAIGSRITAWDLGSQAAYADAYIVSQRSTGLLINPNAYGMWSALAFVFSAFYLRGRTRAMLIALTLTGVYASESRTAMAAVLGSLLAVAVTGRGLSAVVKVVAGGAAFALTLVVANWLGVLQSFVAENTLDRMRSGWFVLTGRGTDENLTGRFEAWSSASRFAAEHWMGTWGPPQVTLGGSIDSQYLAMFLQGSVLLLLAYLLLLISPFLLPKERRRPFVAFAAVVGTMSFTAPAFENTAAMGLIWCAVVIDALRSKAINVRTEQRHSSGESAKVVPV